MPGAHSRAGDVSPFMLSWVEAKRRQGEGLESMEGASPPASSAGPQCITPACGFSLQLPPVAVICLGSGAQGPC